MRGHLRLFVVLLAACAVAMLAVAPAAIAGHTDDPRTKNLHPLGHTLEPAGFLGLGGRNPDIHTDIAFWGKLAFQGNWDGFNIRDISAPGNPKVISRTLCDGDQGDIVVWENILVRSWNSKQATPRNCDGQTVPAGWEGVHVFDISDVNDPELIAAVELPCGSHTVTLAPDLATNRLIVYSNNSSGAGCTGGPANGDFIDVIEILLGDPGSARLLRREPLDGPVTAVTPGCHDMAVILGDAKLAACASADATNVFSLGGARGGSLEDPDFLYAIVEPGVGQAGTNGRWHSAAFTWDGKVIVLGWEPGGGVAAECEATDPDVDKSLFFYDAATGAKLGQWVLPRAQSATENCTIHNYSVVPLPSGRYVLVHGSYQSGTSVVDFTDPASPVEIAWSDPAPLPVPAGTPFCCDVAGPWSSYWYNNFIYETNITEGLNIFRLSARETAGALRLDHFNPLTQEFTLP